MAFALPRRPCSPFLPFWRSWYPWHPSAAGTGTCGGGSDQILSSMEKVCPITSTTILCPAPATSHKIHGDVGPPEEHQAHFRRYKEEAPGTSDTQDPILPLSHAQALLLQVPRALEASLKDLAQKRAMLHHSLMPVHTGPWKLCQFILTMDQPWNLTKASTFIQALGKAVGAASCALSILSSGTAMGTTQQQPQHISSGKQTQTQELKAKPPWNMRKPSFPWL